mmetsp:Transcript_30102/g.87407  ORF Transcript_30102/g.87407 Transcript_30102/m.87407 type:complete len:310 (-) Transcript_30102:701-1630(-)
MERAENIPMVLQVVRRVMREDHKILRRARLNPGVQQILGLLEAAPHRRLACCLARRVVARIRIADGVQVQSNDLRVELRVLHKVAWRGHIEAAPIIRVLVHLGTLGVVLCARARIRVHVVVPVHAVPGHAPKLLGIDVAPLRLPLRIGRARHTIGIEGVADVDDEPYVAKLLELLQHSDRHEVLALPPFDGPVDAGVPTPVANHEEGALAPGRRCIPLDEEGALLAFVDVREGDPAGATGEATANSPTSLAVYIDLRDIHLCVLRQGRDEGGVRSRPHGHSRLIDRHDIWPRRALAEKAIASGFPWLIV